MRGCKDQFLLGVHCVPVGVACAEVGVTAGIFRFVLVDMYLAGRARTQKDLLYRVFWQI